MVRKKRGLAPTDALGDPLPAHAVARLGTARFAAESCFALEWSPDGKWLAGGAMGGFAFLWRRSGELHARLRIAKTRLGDGVVRTLAFSADSSRLLFSSDGTIAIVDVERGKIVGKLGTSTHSGPPFAITPDGDHVVYAGRDESCVVEIASGREVGVVPGRARRFVFLPDGRLAIAASNSLVIVDVANGAVTDTFEDLDPVKGSFHPTLRMLADGVHLARGGPAGAMLIDTVRGEIVARRPWPAEVEVVDASGRVGVRLDGTFLVRDAGLGLRTFDVHTGDLSEPIASVCGRTIALSGNDEIAVGQFQIRLFDRQGRELSPAGRRVERLLGFRGDRIAYVDPEGVLRWCDRSGIELGTWAAPDADPYDVDISGNVVGARESGLRPEGHWPWSRVFDAFGGLRTALWKPGPSDPIAVISPDGAFDAVIERSAGASFVHLRELATGTLVRTIPGPDRTEIYRVAFSAHGQRLVFGYGNGQVGVWERESGASLAVLAQHRKLVSCVGFSPDATRVISGGDDGEVRVWSVATSACLHVLVGLKRVKGVAWSPDGAWIAAGDERETKVWRADTGAELVTLRGGGADVSFDPSSTKLVGGGPPAALLWDLGPLLGES